MPVTENIFFDLALLQALGRGAIVGKTVRIRKPARVIIGDYSIIDDFTYVSAGLKVGRYTHIGANSTIIGGNANVTIGNFVNISPACRLIAASHDYAAGGLSGPTIPKELAAQTIEDDIIIDDHALLGTGTVVLPGTHIPQGLSTGALTLLDPEMKLKPWTLYVGCPAKPLKKRKSDTILQAAKELLAREKHETEK